MDETESGWTLRRGLLQALVLAVLLGGWEVISQVGLVSVHLVPPPSSVALALATRITDGMLIEHGLISLRRFAIGITVAVVVSVPFGLMLAKSGLLRAALYPMVKFMYPIPIAAIIPVALVILGIKDALYIFLVALTAGLPIVIAAVDAGRRVDSTLLETARVLGASPRVLFFRVLVPATLPRIAHATYVAFAIGLIVLITAEIIVSSRGLGSVLVLAQREFRVADMFAGFVVIGVFGMLQGAAVRWMADKIAGWESAYLRKQW